MSKLCPCCGYVPPEDERPESAHCRFDGEKLVTRDELPRDIWKDPAVKEALREGRSANDIVVLRCPDCNQYGYYNEGSGFSCRFCDLTFLVMTEGEIPPQGYRTVMSEDAVRLDDTLTECTEGYDNRTL